MALQKTIVLTALPSNVPLNGRSMENLASLVKAPVSKVSILIDSKRKDVYSTDNISPAPVRKRQRLDHLSMEEKVQRRKLKNRVAAQCARDRKKAKMSSLEEQIEELEAEKKLLLKENLLLKQHNVQLEEENMELKQRLQNQIADIKETSKQTSIKQEEDRCGSFEHASPINVSLQQEQDHHLCTLLMMQFLCLQMIVNLLTFLTLYNSVVKKSSQKIPFLPRLELKELQNPIQRRDPVMKWWGPHQNNWNPSKN